MQKSLKACKSDMQTLHIFSLISIKLLLCQAYQKTAKLQKYQSLLHPVLGRQANCQVALLTNFNGNLKLHASFQ